MSRCEACDKRFKTLHRVLDVIYNRIHRVCVECRATYERSNPSRFERADA